MIVSIRRGVLMFLCVTAVACGSKDDDEDDKENVPQPGALMTEADTAMSSIAFEGQAAGLATVDARSDEHCEEEGNGTKEEYDEESPVVWGCLLQTKTDGPDTPRGAVNRLVQLGCEVDRNIEDGDFEINGEPQEFEAVIDDECWGKDFADKVADEMPDAAEEDGFVHFTMTATGHTSVPADWSDVADEWDAGFEIIFNLEGGEGDTYKVMLNEGDDGFAASILTTSEESPNGEAFALAVTKTGGANDEHEFRYEGRFPYAKFGDGMYGSRHVRVLVAGPYAGEGGFESITSGTGYEAGMYGTYDAAAEEYTDEIATGKLTTFAANKDGIGTKGWQVDAAGEISTGPTEDGEEGINKFKFTSSDAELKAFLTTEVATFTKATTWFKTNGPIDFETVKIGD